MRTTSFAKRGGLASRFFSTLTHSYPLPSLTRTRLSAALRMQLLPSEARHFVALRAAIVLAAKVDRLMEELPCRQVGSAPCPGYGTGSRRRDSCARKPSSLRPSSKPVG